MAEPPRAQAVCGQEALNLLNCVTESPFDQDKCLRFLQALRDCVLDKVSSIFFLWLILWIEWSLSVRFFGCGFCVRFWNWILILTRDSTFSVESFCWGFDYLKIGVLTLPYDCDENVELESSYHHLLLHCIFFHEFGTRTHLILLILYHPGHQLLMISVNHSQRPLFDCCTIFSLFATRAERGVMYSMF